MQGMARGTVLVVPLCLWHFLTSSDISRMHVMAGAIVLNMSMISVASFDINCTRFCPFMRKCLFGCMYACMYMFIASEVSFGMICMVFSSVRKEAQFFVRLCQP